MSLFTAIPADAVMMNREDANELLASFSKHGFDLEELHWPSVEHYFHAMKFTGTELAEKIRLCGHPKEAQKLAKRHFWRVRRDWKKIQRVVMTRGTYIKCRTHQEVADALLATGDKMLVEQSLYDHFWGCGRDGRGDNYYGKMLMDVRDRLKQELSATSQTPD